VVCHIHISATIYCYSTWQIKLSGCPCSIEKTSCSISCKGSYSAFASYLSDTMITHICHIYISAAIYRHSSWSKKQSGYSCSIGKTFYPSCKSCYTACRSDFSDTIVTHVCHIYISTTIYCYSRWTRKFGKHPWSIGKIFCSISCKSRDHPCTSDFSDTMITLVCHVHVPTTIYCYSIWVIKLGGRPCSIHKTRCSLSCESRNRRIGTGEFI